MKYRKRPVEVEATRWYKNGDHPNDGQETHVDSEDGQTYRNEGKVVRYFRHPQIDGQQGCAKCGVQFYRHGFIDTLEGGHIVCPGDWIITGVQGEYYPCKSSIFEITYDKSDLVGAAK